MWQLEKQALRITIYFLKKQCLLVITLNKKHALKQALSMTYTLGKTFLQLLLLNICESFFFTESKKIVSMLWSMWAFFTFQERRRTSTLYKKQIYYSTCTCLVWYTKVYICLEKQQFRILASFLLIFVWETKICTNFTTIRFHFTFYRFTIVDWITIKFISSFRDDFIPNFGIFFSNL